MGLWQQMKSGKTPQETEESRADFSPETQTGGKPEEAAGDGIAGKKRIKDAIDRISDLWSEIESSGGSIAWEWILRGSHYGMRIQKAEDLIDKIGSRGDPASLSSTCIMGISLAGRYRSLEEESILSNMKESARVIAPFEFLKAE